MKIDKNVFNYDGSPALVIFHIMFFISLFLITKINNKTILFQLLVGIFSLVSITGGYHRLWSHKTYESSTILEIFYLIFGTIASQSSAIWWAKSHRTHHRNEESNGDPHNIKKGFYYAHMGWLIHGCDKEEKREISKTDIDDLKKNDLLVFQHNYYIYLYITFFALLTLIPIVFWKETFKNSFLSNFIRIILVLHFTWFVNSLNHWNYGNNKFNQKLDANENLFVSIVSLGEGWHSYHHTYPKDYRASQPNKWNPTTWFINLTKFLGLSKNHYVKGHNSIPHNERFNTGYYTMI